MHATNRRLYRIVDPYLRFWFAVLGDEADAVEGGRGEAVLRKGEQRLRQHVASVFEDECRLHAQRLTDAGRLPGDTVGRWWGMPRDPTTGRASLLEVDMIGLAGKSPVLLGEVKWGPAAGVGSSLRAAAGRIGAPSGATIAAWSARTRPDERGVRGFLVDDLLDG